LTNIAQLRHAADVFSQSGMYDLAFPIYEEVYNQIWSAIGTAQSAVSDFSRNFLIHNIKSSIEFKGSFIESSVHTVFMRRFSLDSDQTLNEFVFTIKGLLQSKCYGKDLFEKSSFNGIMNEFLLIYMLILDGPEERWISSALRVATPILDDKSIKKIHGNLHESEIQRQITSLSGKIKETDWYSLNILLLDFLNRLDRKNTILYKDVSDIVGPYSSDFRNEYKKKKGPKFENDYQRYERYEKYERYERYEKYESKHKHHSTGSTNNQHKVNDEFDESSATESEKAKFFGKVLGLKGKVTTAQIRQKYLEAIALYHPDKVQNLGTEIIEVAEKKTKEINNAYVWFRTKYNF